jgi:hypothetical protein
MWSVHVTSFRGLSYKKTVKSNGQTKINEGLFLDKIIKAANVLRAGYKRL